MFLAVRAVLPRMVVLTGSASATLADLDGSGISRNAAARSGRARSDLLGWRRLLNRRRATGRGRLWLGLRGRGGLRGGGAGLLPLGSACRPSGGSAARRGCGFLLSGAAITVAGTAAPRDLKYSAHVASTELGSAVYCSYISSSSQSLAPKSASGVLVGDSSGTMATVAFFLIRTVAGLTRLRPARGLLLARSWQALLGYPSLRAASHWSGRHTSSARICRDQSRRVTALLSMTSAPSMRQASRQTSTVKTTRAMLRMVVTTVEMMIIA